MGVEPLEHKRFTLEFTGGISLDTFGSHRLMRALIYGVSELYGSDEATHLAQNSDLAVTDLFPWSKTTSKDPLYFLPKPLIPLQMTTTAYSRIKQIKKLRYVSEQLLNKYETHLQSLLLEKDSVKLTNGFLVPGDVSLELQFFQSERPHNLVGRLKQVSEEGTIQLTKEFFFTPELWIKSGGLYFDIKTSDNTILKKIRASIYFLQDRGLGKKISTGNGAFKVHSTTTPSPHSQANDTASNHQSYLLLSHWIPSKTDVKFNLLPEHYQIVKYHPINQRNRANPEISFSLNSIRLITSGSVVSAPSPPPSIIGTNVSIGTEENPSVVWGRAMIIPIPLLQSQTTEVKT